MSRRGRRFDQASVTTVGVIIGLMFLLSALMHGITDVVRAFAVRAAHEELGR